LKRFFVLQDHYDDKRDMTVFHNTAPDLQDQDWPIFWVSDRSYPKTDGLRPHHCNVRSHRLTVHGKTATQFTPMTL